MTPLRTLVSAILLVEVIIIFLTFRGIVQSVMDLKVLFSSTGCPYRPILFYVGNFEADCTLLVFALHRIIPLRVSSQRALALRYQGALFISTKAICVLSVSKSPFVQCLSRCKFDPYRSPVAIDSDTYIRNPLFPCL